MSRAVHSLLFVPGHKPERFDKAANCGASEVILDLEDAVAPSAKVDARAAVATWLGQGHQAFVRINGEQTEWYDDDIRMLLAAPGVGVMLPKAEPESLARTIQALQDRRIVALLETVRGYVEVRQMAALGGFERFAFGSVDFAAESGIVDEGEALTGVRTQIVLESRYAGLAAPVDGVSVNFNDKEMARSDALRSRALGFAGKLCIHPNQVIPTNAAFRPTEDEANWAQQVLAAFESSGGSATTVDGKMIDKPVVDRARQILEECTVHGAV